MQYSFQIGRIESTDGGFVDLHLTGFRFKFVQYLVLLLPETIIAGLKQFGLTVFTNRNVVNDLNVALGQYYVSCYTCTN